MLFAICEICYKRLFVPRLVNGYTCCDAKVCQDRARKRPAKSTLTTPPLCGTLDTEPPGVPTG
jgi:hypothetical protein